jgi:uncharacterized delta-60 repeat protein
MHMASSTILVRGALAAAIALTFTPRADALAPGDIGSVAIFSASGTANGARAGALNPDGSLILAGFGNAGGTSVLARVATGGDVDGTFGSGGLAVYDFNDHLNDELHAIVRMSDGRYAACGQIGGTGTGTDFLTARFASNAALDGSFDFSGFVQTTYLSSGSGAALVDVCNAVAVQADGKIVTAGYTAETGPEHVAVIRYNADGTPDGNFGSGGKLDINASVSPTVDCSAQAVLIQPDNKILVAGNAEGPSNQDFLVIRLNADGTLDQTFGDHGIARNSIGGFDIANAMVLQPDGRIVLAGQSDSDFALVRYTSNGVLDATFGTGGVVKTPVGPGQDVAYGLVRMPWGRYVAVGTARISTSAQGNDIAAVSYNEDGSLDNYFGDGGKRMQAVAGASGPPDEVLNGTLVDLVNGRLWGFGYGTPGAHHDFMAVEFGLNDTIFRNGFQTP